MKSRKLLARPIGAFGAIAGALALVQSFTVAAAAPSGTPPATPPTTTCPVAPTLTDLKAAFGGTALEAIGTFRYRLAVQRGTVSQTSDNVLEPGSGRLLSTRSGTRQWWDGASGWRVSASELALLGEADTKRLRDASAYHFFTLLRDPATQATAAGPHRLRLTPKGGEPFTVTLDPATCLIRDLDFGGGLTGTESDYRDVARARWPFRFTLRTADGAVTEGTFSEVAVSAAVDAAADGPAAFPAPDIPAAATRTLPEPSTPVAVLAGAGWLSGDRNDYNLSLDAAGTTLVFARSEAGFARSRILISQKVDGQWSPPAPVAFTDARYRDSDPWLTPDGEWLYFISDRPPTGDGPPQKHMDIWRVKRQPELGAPEHLAALASGGYELGPEVHEGWIYFNSTRSGGPAPMSIWRARITGNGFAAPEPLPPPFNAGRTQGDFTLSPDGRTALFWQAGADNDGELHASRHTDNGWSAPIRLPAPFNGKGFDFTPAFSADGRWVTYASERRFAGGAVPVLNGLANIYVAPRSVIEAALDRAAGG